MKDGGPAFPFIMNHNELMMSVDPAHRGMTLRDWFAGMELSGACANPMFKGTVTKEMAKYAYKMADMMLEVRHERNP